MALDLTHRVGFVPGPYDGVPPDAGVALGVAWLQQRNPQVVLVPLMRHYDDNDLLRRAVPKYRVMTRRSRHGPSITPTAAVLACWPLEEDLDKLHRHASQGGAVAIIRWDNGWAERAWIDSLAAVNLATGMSGSGLPIPRFGPGGCGRNKVASSHQSLNVALHRSGQSEMDALASATAWTPLCARRPGRLGCLQRLPDARGCGATPTGATCLQWPHISNFSQAISGRHHRRLATGSRRPSLVQGPALVHP